MVTIKEFMARGGKVPGTKGVTMKSLKKDISRVKKRKPKKKTTAPKPITVGPSTPIDRETLLKDTPQPTQQKFKLNFTQDIAEGISSGKLKVSEEIRQAVEAGEFNVVSDISQATQTQTTGVTGIGITGGSLAGMFANLAGKGGVAKNLVTPTGKLVQTTLGTASAFVVNTKTKGMVMSYAARLVAQFKKPPVVAGMLMIGIYTAIKESRSGEVLGKFVGMEEAVQMVGMPKWLSYEFASEVGTPEAWALFEESRELERALLEDQEMWDEVISKIPWANALRGLEKFRAAGIASGLIWDKLAEMRKYQQDNNLTEDDMYRIGREEKKANDIAVIDYYNTERIINEKEVLALKAEADDEEDAETLKILKETIQFWEDKRERDEKSAREETKWNAEFWLAYQKLKDKIASDSKPSNLNFGLI